MAQKYEERTIIPNFSALQALQEPIICLFRMDFITLQLKSEENSPTSGLHIINGR